MREILFRGKGNPKYNDGNWEYGYLCVDSDGDFQICGSCWKRTVIAETIGQYTGLKDKNGEMIFEGDIVKCYTGRICIVTWFCSNAHSGFDITPIGRLDMAPPNKLFLFKDMEIIGNIHDNPDLVKEE